MEDATTGVSAGPKAANAMKQILCAIFPLVKAWLKPVPVSITIVVALLIIPFSSVNKDGIVLSGIILGSIIGLWMSVTLHELGHLVVGRWVDFRFILCMAGPLAFLRTTKGVRICGNESWRLAGMTIMMPERMHALRRRYLWMIAGGPLANLLILGIIGSLFLGLWMIVSSGADKETSEEAVTHSPLWIWSVLLCFTAIAQTGIGCLMQFIVNLWPFRSKKTGMMSDGGRIRMLRRGGMEADRWVALMVLMNASMAGRRPKEWDDQLIQPATALSDNSADEGQACLWAYLWALDRGTVDLAGEYLERLERLGEKLPLLKPFAAAEVAFFEAWHRDNLECARERLAHAYPGKNEPRLRAETAIRLREGCWAEAKQCGEAALDALANASTWMDAGINVAKVEWIHCLLLEAERGAT